jgi:excisionase family DNA binding protein
MLPMNPYLTVPETIAYLKLGSRSALYRLIREHALPFVRVGGRYRFDVREIDAWTHGHTSAVDWVRAQKKVS